MSAIDKTKDETKDLCYGRGDSFASPFTIEIGGVAVNIAGWTFKLSVNADKNPTGAPLFTVVGAITDAPNGRVEFSPDITDTDQEIKTYFYDIESIDAAGGVRTAIKGKFLIVQDITK